MGCGGCAGALILLFAVVVVVGVARNPDGSFPVNAPAPPAQALPSPPTQTINATTAAAPHPSETAATSLTAPKADEMANASTNESPQPPKIATVVSGGKNPLDRFMEDMRSKGIVVIDSYHIEDGILYIEFNEDTWDSMTKDQEHRLCDILAQTDFINVMNVPVAYLTIDGGRTTIGDIAHTFLSGPHCVFEPRDDYWNYK